LEDHTREATHVVPMGNYVIAEVGNYVIENPSNLGNYVIADKPPATYRWDRSDPAAAYWRPNANC